MSAMSAYCSGAGLVTLVYPDELSIESVSGWPELMATTIADFAASPLRPDRDVVVVGPGWPPDRPLNDLLDKLAQEKVVTILDAGALRIIGAQQWLAPGRWIMTPHEGEAASLLHVSPKDVSRNRLEAAKKISAHFKAVVLLKGPGSIVTDGAQHFVLDVGSSSLATAGSGDVLCGVISACVAQGLDDLIATVASGFYHGRAGEIWEQIHGTRGARATEFIPIIRTLINGKQ
jgi:hydroxyethylthiazole kinase-like uncharacterized protein yjeF